MDTEHGSEGYRSLRDKAMNDVLLLLTESNTAAINADPDSPDKELLLNLSKLLSKTSCDIRELYD